MTYRRFDRQQRPSREALYTGALGLSSQFIKEIAMIL